MTKEQILNLLRHDQRAVERALLTLLSRQTAGEQATGTTREQNGRGFNAFDAKPGTYYAKWVQSGRHLTGTYLDRARKLVCRYVGQLVEVSQARLQSSTLHVNDSTLARLDPFQAMAHGKQGALFAAHTYQG